MRDIGKNIKTLREGKGMTQEALAEQLFVTRQTISNYETGRTRPDIEMLMKIAQALETDANTVLYGPPVSREKAGWKRLIISAAAFLLLGLLTLALHRVSLELRKQTFLSFPYMAANLLLDPAVMTLGGWTVMQTVGLILKAQPLKNARRARYALLGLAGLCLAVLLPFLIWNGAADWQLLTTGSVRMDFPNIPVYRQVFYWLVVFTTKYCPLYALLGVGLWLTGFPPVKEEPAAPFSPLD